MWDIERDPELRSTVVAVAVLDRVPAWDRLVRRLDDVPTKDDLVGEVLPSRR